LKNLTATEKSFLSNIQKIVFSNPYGDECRQACRTFSNGKIEHPADLLDSASTQVDQLLGKLRKEDNLDLARYSEDERWLLHHGVIFICYHRYAERFRKLIEEQFRQEGANVKVAFAAEALGIMTRAGMSADIAKRYFAFFYQMQRALYFLDKTLVGTSPSMDRLRHDLWNTIFSHDFSLYEQFLWESIRSVSTIFVGEPGVGKEASAMAVIGSGFVPFEDKTMTFAEPFSEFFKEVNLAQHDGVRLESELFGHQKGAFTEAVENYQGVLSRCSAYDVIYLDGICKMPDPVQAKLASVLQHRTFTPVGSHTRQTFAGRVMASTRKTPKKLLADNDMREDLYYQLCVNEIHVPSLRQRFKEKPSEFELMISHVIHRFTGQDSGNLVGRVIDGMPSHISPGYKWPGNVSELEQIVKKILLVKNYESKPTHDN